MPRKTIITPATNSSATRKPRAAKLAMRNKADLNASAKAPEVGISSQEDTAPTMPSDTASAPAKTITRTFMVAGQGTKRSVQIKMTKVEKVLKLLRTKTGVTVPAIMEATDWQAHSVRGFLSGTVKKRMKLELTSEVGKDGTRRYRVPVETISG